MQIALSHREQIRAERRRRERRDDFLAFATDTLPGYRAGWVHRDLADVLMRFSAQTIAKQSPRTMITMPPRHGKSFLASERFPVWHLAKAPEHEIVIASYGLDPAKERSEAARDVMRMEVTAETFPKLDLKPETKAKINWKTTGGGGVRAVGVNGGLTSMGAHVLIIDDPVKDWAEASSPTIRKATWDWYTSTGYTRLAPGAGILLIQTRWHQDDLAGRLLEQMKYEGEDWEVFHFEALASKDEEHRKAGEALHPARYSAERLEQIRKVLGEQKWNAIYQGSPTSSEGNIIKRVWFCAEDRVPEKFDLLCISCDASHGGQGENASRTVLGLWGRLGNEFWRLDEERGRWEAPEQLRRFERFCNKSPLHKLAGPKIVENKAAGRDVIQTFKRRIPGIIAVNPSRDKATRLRGVSHLFEARNVKTWRNAPWREAWENEVCDFPGGRFDDRVDETSQALAWLEGKRPLKVSVIG